MSGQWPEVRYGDFRIGKERIPQPEWFDRVVPGSVVRQVDGPFRIIREVVRRSRDSRLMYVSMVIRRRSWTNRAYTTMTANDLRCRGFKLVEGVRVKPKTILDVKIDQAIRQRDSEPFIITASDVIGIP